MKKRMRFAAAFLAVITIIASLSFGASADGAYTPVTDPSCEAVYAVNDDTGLVMYAKNENEKLYPASLTKTMTALLILEKVPDLDGSSVTMTSDILSALYGTDSSNIGLVAGETLTYRQILYAMLLRSGGDAALMAAKAVGGTVDGFVQLMNDRAAELGCTGTHFTNPIGLHDENHYTTASDMYRITAQAMLDPTFREIVASTSYVIPATEKKDARTLYTTNNMMLSGQSVYYKAVKGIKTGFTTPAGPCLAVTATSGGVTYTMIVMKAALTAADGSVDKDGAFKVARGIFDWLFSDFEMKSAIRAGDSINCSIKVNYGSGSDSVALVAGEDFVTMLPKNSEGVSLSYTVPSAVDAPVEAGQKIADAEVVISGITVGSVSLVTASAIKKSEISYIFAQIGEFFSSGVMIAIVCVLAVLVVGYIVLNILYNRKKKRGYSSGRRGKAVKRGRDKNIFR